MAKHVSIAYFLWFFFGIFGLHLFYLGRDRHAFFTWATIGGVFGIGIWHDMFNIPKYTAAANETTEYLTDRHRRMAAKQQPSFSTGLFFATGLIGWLFGLLVFMIFWDEEMHPRYYYAISVLAHLFIAFGVHYISNEGENLVQFKWCLLGSFAALPFTLKFGYGQILYGAGASTLAAWNKVEWRRTPRNRRFCTRVIGITFVGLMWWGMIGSAIYFNGSFQKDGERVKIKDAVKNFFKSPAWRETKEILKQMYDYYQHHGWSKFYEQFLESIDPQGENNAYEVLGLDKQTATQEEIKKAYKQLARRWHPDKVKDAEEKKVAQEKFMEIQEAYNILSDIQKNRKDKVEL